MATKKGRMTRARMAHTIPVDAPLYPSLPIRYRNVERLVFTYETDEEAALDVLPDVLELELPATAIINIMNIPYCTLGAYHEAYLSLNALLDGEPVFYCVYNLMDNDAAVAIGREVWGIPKKMGHITVESKTEAMIGTVERPLGTRILTGIVRPEFLAKDADNFSRPLVAIRIVPHPEGKEPPLIQLVDHINSESSKCKLGPGWEDFQLRGQGSITFHAHSAVDPWHKFKVVRMIDAMYSGGPSSFDLPYGKILKTL
jgi:acetoacetate decarboxylase